MSELDILAIRDGLNALPFRDGRRRVFLGRISDKFPPPRQREEDEDEEEEEEEDVPKADPPEVLAYLERTEQELGKHDLFLVRGLDDLDSLYAVQQLRKSSRADYGSMAEAMQWVSRITTVSLEMVLPAVVGMWLDRRQGTSIFAPLGLLVGVPLGFWHLLQMTRKQEKEEGNGKGNGNDK